MISGLREQYRSVFTIRVGPQRITFMSGPEAQRSFIKATDKELDQAAVYKFTIPVFGKGVVYDSPLDERLQQARRPRAHPPLAPPLPTRPLPTPSVQSLCR